jgi:hypothetical protein
MQIGYDVVVKTFPRVVNQKMAIMANPRKRMCASSPCFCLVPDGEDYCGPACRDAGSKDVEITCQCDHTGCPVMSLAFAAGCFDQPIL